MERTKFKRLSATVVAAVLALGCTKKLDKETAVAELRKQLTDPVVAMCSVGFGQGLDVYDYAGMFVCDDLDHPVPRVMSCFSSLKAAKVAFPAVAPGKSEHCIILASDLRRLAASKSPLPGEIVQEDNRATGATFVCGKSDSVEILDIDQRDRDRAKVRYWVVPTLEAWTESLPTSCATFKKPESEERTAWFFLENGKWVVKEP